MPYCTPAATTPTVLLSAPRIPIYAIRFPLKILCSFRFEYCLVTNLTHPPYWENKPLDLETVENRLTFGLYWAISMIMFTSKIWGLFLKLY